MPKLEAKNICYTYGNGPDRVQALFGVSAIFESGKTHAIVGRSGCGKTTLLSLLAGHDAPQEGEIYLDEKNIADISPSEYRLKNISMIYQNYELLPFLTSEENVALASQLRGHSKSESISKARSALESVGLGSEFFKRRPPNMSGGQQQRVAIARALVADTGIILADEPTGNLDSENCDNIVRILTDLAHRRGFCVVVVTHDSEVAKQADVVFHMRDGRILSVTDNHVQA